METSKFLILINSFSANRTALLAFIAINLFVIIPKVGQAQNPDKYIRQGNKLYKDSIYDGAEQKYARALEADPNYEKGIYNQGNAYYQQKKHEEAIKNYELSAGLIEDPKQKAAAYHNLGNSYFDSKQYEQSIEAYKNALRQNPNDADTKYNLMVAKKMLEDQQKQNQDKQDQNQDQQNQDQQNQENQESESENQDQQNGDQQDQQQQNPSEQENQEGEQPQPSGMKPSKLTPEEVKRILEALANDEKNTVKDIIKNEHKAKPNKSDKDW
jgi:Ca-activated chloride channel family protein